MPLEPRVLDAIDRVAVLGYGYWGPNQVRAFCNLLGEERVLVCETDPSRLALARDRHPGVCLVTDHEAVLADETVAAVSLCTPAGVHAEQAHRFLSSGRHVLVEKPLATNSADGQRLVNLAAERGLELMVGHLFLFHAAVRTLRRLIQAGDLGQIHYVTGVRSSLGPRVRNEVNIVWDYLIHDAYIVPHLLGQDPVAVRADGGSWLRQNVADVVFATLDFPGGTVAHLESSWYYPVKTRRMVIVGSQQMAVWDEDAGAAVTVYQRGYAPYEGVDEWGNEGLRLYDDGAQAIGLEPAEPLLLECEQFLTGIVSKQESAASGRRALQTLHLLEAIDHSLSHGNRRVGIGEGLG